MRKQDIGDIMRLYNNQSGNIMISFVSPYTMLRLFVFTFLILPLKATTRTRIPLTTVTNSTSNSDVPSLKSLSTPFNSTVKSYGFVFEVNTLHDIVLHSIDLHTTNNVTKSIQVRIKSGSSENFNSSTPTWTLVSNATNVVGEKINVGYRTSIPQEDFSPTLLFKDNLYSVYVTLGTPSLLSTTSSNEMNVIVKDEYSLQLLKGSIVERYPSTMTTGGYGCYGAIKYNFNNVTEQALSYPSLLPIRQQPRNDILTNFTSTKTMISFSYKPPYSPIDARGRSEIDESIRDIISENLETKKIHVLALQSIFTEDTASCADCYMITSVVTVKHNTSISSNKAKEIISSLGPALSYDIPNLDYALPNLLQANLFFTLQGSSNLKEYEIQAENVEIGFSLLFEEVMIDFLNARLTTLTPPANIISVKVKDPNTLEEPHSRTRLPNTHAHTKNVIQTSSYTEYVYNLDTIITGEFILFSEESFETFVYEKISENLDLAVKMLDHKMNEFGYPVKVNKMKLRRGFILQQDAGFNIDKGNMRRIWLLISTGTLLVCLAVSLGAFLCIKREITYPMSKRNSLVSFFTSSNITRSKRSSNDSDTHQRRSTFSWTKMSSCNETKDFSIQYNIEGGSTSELESASNEDVLNGNIPQRNSWRERTNSISWKPRVSFAPDIQIFQSSRSLREKMNKAFEYISPKSTQNNVVDNFCKTHKEENDSVRASQILPKSLNNGFIDQSNASVVSQNTPRRNSWAFFSSFKREFVGSPIGQLDTISSIQNPSNKSKRNPFNFISLEMDKELSPNESFEKMSNTNDLNPSIKTLMMQRTNTDQNLKSDDIEESSTDSDFKSSIELNALSSRVKLSNYGATAYHHEKRSIQRRSSESVIPYLQYQDVTNLAMSSSKRRKSCSDIGSQLHLLGDNKLSSVSSIRRSIQLLALMDSFSSGCSDVEEMRVSAKSISQPKKGHNDDTVSTHRCNVLENIPGEYKKMYNFGLANEERNRRNSWPQILSYLHTNETFVNTQNDESQYRYKGTTYPHISERSDFGQDINQAFMKHNDLPLHQMGRVSEKKLESFRRIKSCPELDSLRQASGPHGISPELNYKNLSRDVFIPKARQSSLLSTNSSIYAFSDVEGVLGRRNSFLSFQSSDWERNSLIVKAENEAIKNILQNSEGSRSNDLYPNGEQQPGEDISCDSDTNSQSLPPSYLDTHQSMYKESRRKGLYEIVTAIAECDVENQIKKGSIGCKIKLGENSVDSGGCVIVNKKNGLEALGNHKSGNVQRTAIGNTGMIAFRVLSQKLWNKNEKSSKGNLCPALKQNVWSISSPSVRHGSCTKTNIESKNKSRRSWASVTRVFF